MKNSFNSFKMEGELCVPGGVSEINFTQFDYNFTSTSHFKSYSWKDYCTIVLYVLAIVVGLMGNIGVILTVVMNRNMRTTINIYLTNLAFADLLICLFCMLVYLVNNLTDPAFVLGAFMCKFNGFAQMAALTTSVLTLSAIACDRFIAILFPLHVRITKQRTSLVIAAIWIVSSIVAVPFLIYRKQMIFNWRSYLQASCEEQWPGVIEYGQERNKCHYPSKQFYYTFVTISLFFIPVIIMVTAYSVIIWRLWISEMPGNKTAANTTAHNRAKKKVIQLVCIVLVAFVVCWMPFQVTVLYSQFGHKSQESGELPAWFAYFSSLSLFLAYSNSSLNPVIYAGFNNNFRQGLCAVFGCRCHKQLLQGGGSKKSTCTMSTGTSWNQSTCRYKVNGSTRDMELNHVKSQDASWCINTQPPCMM